MTRPILSLLLLSSSFAAAEPLRLEQALNEAQSGSPRLQKAQAALEAAEAQHGLSRAAFLPRVDGGATRFLAKKYAFLDVALPGAPDVVSIPQIFPTTSAELDASLNIFRGFKDYHHYRASSLQEEAASREVDWTRFQIEQEVRLNFFKALAAQELEKVAQQNVKTFADHLKQVQALRSAGQATHFDVLRVEVQLHEAQTEELSAGDNVVLARRHLSESMGLTDDARELVGSLPAPEAKLSLTEENSSERADLKALRARTEAADQERAAAQSSWLPALELMGQYQVYNNRNDALSDRAAYRSAYQLGLGLRWNLFDGGASYYQRAALAAHKVEAEKALRASELHAPVDLEFWRRRYLYSAALFSTKSSDVEKAAESVRLATEGLRAGTRTTTEALDAELDLFRARAGVIHAQLSALESRLNLELALGRRI